MVIVHAISFTTTGTLAHALIREVEVLLDTPRRYLEPLTLIPTQFSKQLGTASRTLALWNALVSTTKNRSIGEHGRFQEALDSRKQNVAGRQQQLGNIPQRQAFHNAGYWDHFFV